MRPKISSKSSKSLTKRAQQKSRPFLIWGSIGVGVIGLVSILLLNLRGPSPIRDIVTFIGQQRGHDNTQVYNDALPPAGGLHSDVWQNCGIYDEPVDTANAVHSLEHGAVWIAYQPSLSAAELSTLQELVRGESYLLLSPYENLKSPVVLTAWEVQLEVKDVDDRRIAEFIDQYRQGPTTPELGATCSDGVGTPIQ